MTQQKKQQADVGVVGMGVMGHNLALNIEEKGYTVGLWNRTTSKTDRLVAENPEKKLIPSTELDEFVSYLQRPRKIITMIQSGPAVDAVLDSLKPLLTTGDIVLDGGNSHYEATQRRYNEFAQDGILFIGMGVSGGEEGARHGPSIMPGGSSKAYEQVRPILEKIAAQTESGPCVTFVGPDGAGHFVKMVHNGIEYGIMQLIAEVYDLLRKAADFSAPELAEVFTDWNDGPLGSFLVELTGKILGVQDEETHNPLVDMILDRAEQKGTGIWSVKAALELGVSVPTIYAAVNARGLSSLKETRVKASKLYKKAEWQPLSKHEKQELLAAAHDALYGGTICSYAEGLSLISAASDYHNWDVNLKEVARIWKGGCIIRAKMLHNIMEAYDNRPALRNLLLDEDFAGTLERIQPRWRKAVTAAQTVHVPVPAMTSSLAYFDSYKSEFLPQNLTDAQRDAFGAHTYTRIDHPERGFVHTNWEEHFKQLSGMK